MGALRGERRHDGAACPAIVGQAVSFTGEAIEADLDRGEGRQRPEVKAGRMSGKNQAVNRCELGLSFGLIFHLLGLEPL